MHCINTFCCIAFCIAFYRNVHAQADLQNAVYADVGGNAFYYSLNFERTFSKNIAGRVGICVVPRTLIIPVLAGKYFGNGSHHLEAMAGLDYVYLRQETEDIDHRHELLATAFIGYRFQKPKKRFLFHVGWTPHLRIFDTYSPFRNHAFSNWAGIGFGYRLK